MEQGFAFLIALGAVLRFAVCISTLGFNLHTIGPILLIVGIVGLVVSVLLMPMWSDRRRGVATDNRRDGTVVRDPDLP